MSYDKRLHGEKLRLNINFLNRISRSSLGSLKLKHLQQSFIKISNTGCLKQLHQETSNSEVE